MAFFDNLKDKAKDLAQSGIEKSKQLSEIAKLNLNNVAEEDTIKKAYIEIGKLYYDAEIMPVVETLAEEPTEKIDGAFEPQDPPQE